TGVYRGFFMRWWKCPRLLGRCAGRSYWRDGTTAAEGRRTVRAQATGALHSRIIENRMVAAKKARVRRRAAIARYYNTSRDPGTSGSVLIWLSGLLLLVGTVPH